jgi:hypothetical protein
MSTNTGFAKQDDHFHGRRERERRGDHLVVPADPETHQCDQQGLGSARYRDAMLGTGERCESRLELDDLRPHDVLAMLEDDIYASADLRLESLELRLQVDERDGHFFSAVRLSPSKR